MAQVLFLIFFVPEHVRDRIDGNTLCHRVCGEH